MSETELEYCFLDQTLDDDPVAGKLIEKKLREAESVRDRIANVKVNGHRLKKLRRKSELKSGKDHKSGALDKERLEPVTPLFRDVQTREDVSRDLDLRENTLY